ncbi:MAG: hypothetical protein ABIG44_14185 [Planctomycetota bacterium]
MIQRTATCGVMFMLATLCLPGCASRHMTVADTFPKAARAAPWELQGEVWSGTFSQAIIALGDDAKDWHRFNPSQVWLAVYRHQENPQRKMTIRTFAFDSPDNARQAYRHFRPADAREFLVGDSGCWTEIGVLYVWGRLVFDIFGSEAAWESEVQSAVLAGYIQGHMPAGLPDAPQ